MTEWLRILARIAVLRAGPQDLPSGNASVITALLFYASIVLVSGLAADDPAPGPDLLIALVVPFACTVLLLVLRGVPARLNQTVSALFGTGALISLVNLPIWFNNAVPMPPPLVLLALAALFWSLAVDAHIWRSALEIPYAGGLVTAVVILLVQLYTFQAFLSTPVP
jgi:hypothetical protein